MLAALRVRSLPSIAGGLLRRIRPLGTRLPAAVRPCGETSGASLRCFTRYKIAGALILLLLSLHVGHAQIAGVMPEVFPQYFDANGNPLSAGTITFYFAGTTTPQAAYTDSGRVVPVENPLTLDSTGRPTTSIFLAPNNAYKIVLKDAAGVTIRSADNIADTSYLAALAVAPVFQLTTSTGTVNDFNLTGSFGSPTLSLLNYSTLVLRVNNAAPLFLTGFTAGVPGQRLVVIGIGAAPIFFVNQSVGSLSGNRMATFQDTTPMTLTGIAEFIYDGQSGLWRMVANDFGAPAAYTATWTGFGSNPAIGNGTMTGRYFVNGHLCYVDITLTMGSTTTYGTGYWAFALPLPAIDNIGQVGGSALLYDASATTFYHAVPVVDIGAAQVFVQLLGASSNNVISSSAPFTWANTDQLRLSFWYFTH